MIPSIHTIKTTNYNRFPIANAVEMLQLVIGTWALVLYNQYSNCSIQDSTSCTMNANLNCLFCVGLFFIWDTMLNLTLSVCNYLLNSKQTVLFELFDMAAVCARIVLHVASMYLVVFLVRHLPSTCSRTNPTEWNQLKLFSNTVLMLMITRWLYFGWVHFDFHLPGIIAKSEISAFEEKKKSSPEPVYITSSA